MDEKRLSAYEKSLAELWHGPIVRREDAYVLGINKAVPSFSGVVIAVIRRKDDIEGKLVVAPEGVSYSDEEILKEVAFQEQYFESVLLR